VKRPRFAPRSCWRGALALGLLLTALLPACGTTPRPRIMQQVDAVRAGAAAKEAKQFAPQAYAHAENLREQAEKAHTDDDMAGAQILSEHSLAAFNHAFVLARLAKAQRRLALAESELTDAQERLRALDTEQQKVAAEADDLEMRIKVMRDALPLVPNEPASPEREKARWNAARSLAMQAELLCAATRLIDPNAPGAAEHAQPLAALEKALSVRSGDVPIDEAIRLRLACLRSLTLARRPATRKAPAAGHADELLARLSEAGNLNPFRDDRGVVVVLRGVVSASGKLTTAGAERLGMLGRTAKAHPTFPVLVVVHSAKHGPSTGDRARAEAVEKALEKAGAPTVEARVAGDAQPVVDRKRKGAAQRNARIEIVFVSPAS
jgi:hypothetical protein